ncbi:MAG: hypothetical protein AB9880_10610 [Christensenellales bacterium]
MAAVPSRRMLVLFLLALAMLALGAEPALADPYPSNVQATPVDATSILITWDLNTWAQGYRIHRTNTGIIAQVPADVNAYLDTGLAPGLPYVYMVASVVDGKDYWYGGATPMAMPMDAPAGITSLAWRTQADYDNKLLLMIDAGWPPLAGVNGYELFARVGDAGEYTQWTEMIENAVTAGFSLPAEPTRYWFKVRGYISFYTPESDEYQYFTGPFSAEASIEVPALSSPGSGILQPHISLVPLHPLQTAAPTLRRVTRQPLTPVLQPAVTMRIPNVSLVTPAPSAPPLVERLAPLVTLSPLRRISP